jgi:hypothetical protein
MIEFVVLFSVAIILYRFLRFITTPWLRKLGVYRYYRRFFFIVRFGRLNEIHLGTSWDFFRACEVTPRRILLDVLDGLLDLCDDTERGIFSWDSSFRGYTYYFKPQTLRRFGFTVRPLNLAETFLFALGLMEMAILNCISHRRWVIFPFHRVYIVQFTAKQLSSQRNALTTLRNTLKNDGCLKRAA